MPTFCEVSHQGCLRRMFLIHNLLHMAKNGHEYNVLMDILARFS